MKTNQKLRGMSILNTNGGREDNEISVYDR